MRKSFLLGSVAIFVAGCSVQTTPLTQEELRVAATQQVAAMFPTVQQVEGSLTESDVVTRALVNNLDTRLARLESTYAMSQLNVDNLNMLPTLAVNAGYVNKSVDGYSTSQVLGDATTTGSYSRGSEEAIGTGDLSVTWNVLDMAVGYFSAQQTADRALIAQERERRASLDLVRRAKEAFWRAYAAERLSGQVARNIREADNVIANIQRGEASGAIPRLEALQQRRTVLETVRQLEILKQELDIARIELNQMINVAPGQDVDLEAGSMAALNIGRSLPELEQMAYDLSPDIREQEYRSRIAIADVKRSSAELFPNLSATASLNYSTDDFLLNDDWNQYGLNVGWNLMRLASAPQRTATARQGIEVEEARALAVRMAVLAQTHIAYRQYTFARQQFNRADELYRIEQQLAEQNRARENASVGNEVDRIVSDTNAIMAQVRRYQAYATLVSSHDALKATVGDDTELAGYIAQNQQRLDTAVADAASAEATIATSAQTAADMAKSATALQRDASKLANDRTKLDADLARATDRRAAAAAEVEALSAELAAQPALEEGEGPTRTMQRLERKIAAANDDVAGYDAQIAQINAAIEANTAAQADVAAQIAAAAQAQADAEAAAAAATAALADAQARQAYYE